MCVKQSTPHLHLSNSSDTYGNPDEYIIRVSIKDFVQLSIEFFDERPIYFSPQRIAWRVFRIGC